MNPNALGHTMIVKKKTFAEIITLGVTYFIQVQHLCSATATIGLIEISALFKTFPILI